MLDVGSGARRRPGIMRRPVIHATARGTHAFYARSLETGESAIIVTTPYKLSSRERWSWKLGAVVRLKNRKRYAGSQPASARSSFSP